MAIIAYNDHTTLYYNCTIAQLHIFVFVLNHFPVVGAILNWLHFHNYVFSSIYNIHTYTQTQILIYI